jgi:hypothetical protein
MIPTKKMPGGGWGARTGRGTMDCFKDITALCKRQLVRISLPWIAAVVIPFCSPSGKAGRFLDRLNVLAEGGGDDI